MVPGEELNLGVIGPVQPDPDPRAQPPKPTGDASALKASGGTTPSTNSRLSDMGTPEGIRTPHFHRERVAS